MTEKYSGEVLVVGGSGRVGKYIVDILEREKISYRLIFRDATKVAEAEKRGVKAFQVDLSDKSAAKEKLQPALEGVKAVLSALGSRKPFSSTEGLREVDYEGTRLLVDAAKAAHVEHFILNSTMGILQKPTVLKPLSLLFHPKWEAEQYLIKSGLVYTIIRPGGLVDSDAAIKGPPSWTHKPAFAEGQADGSNGFAQIGRVHRQDVAEAMVKSLELPVTHNKIYEVLDRSGIQLKNRPKIISGIFD